MAIDYMLRQYNAICVRSSGSHGVADLICGNGTCVYVVQVKGGLHLPYISWAELENFAKLFKGQPMLLYKPDYKRILECKTEGDLVRLRAYLRNVRSDANVVRKM